MKERELVAAGLLTIPDLSAAELEQVRKELRAFCGKHRVRRIRWRRIPFLWLEYFRLGVRVGLSLRLAVAIAVRVAVYEAYE